MECAPHNWGGVFDHAVHFPLEPSMPNCQWFELTTPQGDGYRPCFQDTFRVDREGYVPASTKPRLGVEIDRNVLDNMILRVER